MNRYNPTLNPSSWSTASNDGDPMTDWLNFYYMENGMIGNPGPGVITSSIRGERLVRGDRRGQSGDHPVLNNGIWVSSDTGQPWHGPYSSASGTQYFSNGKQVRSAAEVGARQEPKDFTVDVTPKNPELSGQLDDTIKTNRGLGTMFDQSLAQTRGTIASAAPAIKSATDLSIAAANPEKISGRLNTINSTSKDTIGNSFNRYSGSLDDASQGYSGAVNRYQSGNANALAGQRRSNENVSGALDRSTSDFGERQGRVMSGLNAATNDYAANSYNRYNRLLDSTAGNSAKLNQNLYNYSGSQGDVLSGLAQNNADYKTNSLNLFSALQDRTAAGRDSQMANLQGYDARQRALRSQVADANTAYSADQTKQFKDYSTTARKDLTDWQGTAAQANENAKNFMVAQNSAIKLAGQGGDTQTARSGAQDNRLARISLDYDSRLNQAVADRRMGLDASLYGTGSNLGREFYGNNLNRVAGDAALESDLNNRYTLNQDKNTAQDWQLYGTGADLASRFAGRNDALLNTRMGLNTDVANRYNAILDSEYNRSLQANSLGAGIDSSVYGARTGVLNAQMAADANLNNQRRADIQNQQAQQAAYTNLVMAANAGDRDAQERLAQFNVTNEGNRYNVAAANARDFRATDAATAQYINQLEQEAGTRAAANAETNRNWSLFPAQLGQQYMDSRIRNAAGLAADYDATNFVSAKQPAWSQQQLPTVRGYPSRYPSINPNKGTYSAPGTPGQPSVTKSADSIPTGPYGKGTYSAPGTPGQPSATQGSDGKWYWWDGYKWTPATTSSGSITSGSRINSKNFVGPIDPYSGSRYKSENPNYNSYTDNNDGTWTRKYDNAQVWFNPETGRMEPGDGSSLVSPYASTSNTWD